MRPVRRLWAVSWVLPHLLSLCPLSCLVLSHLLSLAPPSQLPFSFPVSILSVILEKGEAASLYKEAERSTQVIFLIRKPDHVALIKNLSEGPFRYI